MVDFHRVNHTPPILVNIQGMDIKIVQSYKVQGVHPTNKLDWTDNTNTLYKKGQGKLYLQRKLGSFAMQGHL